MARIIKRLRDVGTVSLDGRAVCQVRYDFIVTQDEIQVETFGATATLGGQSNINGTVTPLESVSLEEGAIYGLILADGERLKFSHRDMNPPYHIYLVN